MTLINLGNRVVNNFLISSDIGYILIDTGYAGSFPRFMKKLEKNHIRPEEIKYIFLTHAHDDHAGFLNDVLSATDADVILHSKAVDGLKKGQNSFEGGCSSRLAWLSCQMIASNSALVIFETLVRSPIHARIKSSVISYGDPSRRIIRGCPSKAARLSR